MIKLLTVLITAMSFMTPFSAHGADKPVVPIQQLKTPSGISVWLVESHTLPMVSVEVAFEAGSMYDPQGKEGVANFTANMLTQGGSNGLSSDDFLKQTERLGMGIGADADPQTLSVSLQALSENIDEAFTLFATAIKKPDFNQADFERVKQALLASRKRVKENPTKLANEAFDQLVYGRYHPYAHPVMGTDYSLPKMTNKDVQDYYKHMLVRKNMVVSIVGDITPQKALELVETHLKDLPKGTAAKAPDAPQVQPPVLKKISLPVPQTSIIMGHKGISRTNPDYFATLLMNHILGSGGFSSILMEEVREKRGLAYGISSYFDPMPHWGAFQVGVKTKNQSAYEVVDIVKQQIQNLIDNGVSQEAYEEAMDYMVGSFPLRLDSNNDILSYLTFMQVENMGADYLDKWVARIREVTQADIHRVAKKYLDPNNMIVVMVGQPDAPNVKAAEPEAAAPKAVAAPAKIEKPVPAEAPIKVVAPKPEPAPQPIPEDVVVEEESVAAPIQKADSNNVAAAKPVTVIPNDKLVIEPEKAEQPKPAPKVVNLAPNHQTAKKVEKKTDKVDLKKLQMLRDPKVTVPHKRRNVNDDEWL